MDDYQDYNDDDEGGDRTPGYVKGSATSEHAARSMDPKARRARVGQILALFEEGATYTRDEIVGMLDSKAYSSITARISELSKAGILVETGETRITMRGKPADVLKQTPGTSMKTYLAYLKSRSDVDAPKARLNRWVASIKTASLKYKQSPTRENLDALGVIAETVPQDSVAASSASPPNDDGFTDDEDVIEWAMRH